MKKYRINKIFYSLQGEGVRAGTPNVFIRFAGCNLSCAFCDTEFKKYKEYTAEDIVRQVCSSMVTPRAVVLTGGEPTLQYDTELYDALKIADIYIAVETNGTCALKALADWITCSPKTTEDVVQANFPHGVQELKYVMRAGQELPCPKCKANNLILSPIFRNDDCIEPGALEWCIELVKRNPAWRLSVQQHKSWGIR